MESEHETAVLTVDFWLVKANPNHGEGLLHTLTAQHLLTCRPRPGDEIAGVGEATVVRYTDRVTINARIWGPRDADHNSSVWRVRSHPGRSAMLGEDQLGDAYGQQIVCGFIADHLIVPDEDPSQIRRWKLEWTYEPVEAECLPFLDAEQAGRESETFQVTDGRLYVLEGAGA